MPAKRDYLQTLLEPSIDQSALLDALCPLENAGNPTGSVTPRHLYDMCVDTAAGDVYMAFTLLPAGWKKLNN